MRVKQPRSAEDWYDIQQLDERIWGIGEFGYIEEVCSFVVIGDQKAAIIDTGTGFFNIQTAVKKITQLPCKVFNTHSHFDHIGSNAEFSEAYLFDHADTRDAAKHGMAADYLQKFTLLEAFFGHKPKGMRTPFAIPPFPSAQFFSDGDILDLDPFRFEVLHTPGHCDDHASFYDQTTGILFAGDILYDGPIYIEAEGGLMKYRRSIERVCELKNLKLIFGCHNNFEFKVQTLQTLKMTLDQIKTVELKETIQVTEALSLIPIA